MPPRSWTLFLILGQNWCPKSVPSFWPKPEAEVRDHFWGRPPVSIRGAAYWLGVDLKVVTNLCFRFWPKTGHGKWVPVLGQNLVQGRPPNAPSPRRLSGLECWGGGVQNEAWKVVIFKWTHFPQYTPFENRISKGVYWGGCTTFWAKRRDHFSVDSFWPKKWPQNDLVFCPLFFFFFFFVVSCFSLKIAKRYYFDPPDLTPAPNAYGWGLGGQNNTVISVYLRNPL